MKNLVNVNKSTEVLLVTGAQLINKENGTIAQVFSKNSEGKYNVIVGDEEKVYSFATLQRNWQIVEEETIEEVEEAIAVEFEDDDFDDEVNMEQVLIEAEVVDEEEAEEEKIEIKIDDENHIEDLKGVPTPIVSDDIYIFDNKAEKVGKVNVTGHIYGVPVKADNINQTTMWKVLMELYKNRKEENDVYPLEQKQFCVKTLREIDSEIFEGAYKCLVSKTKKEYIDSLLEA